MVYNLLKESQVGPRFFYCFLFAWCSFSEFALFVSEGMGLYVGRLVWKTSTTQNAENEQFSKLTLNRVNYFNKCHFVVLRFVGGFYLHISHNKTVLLTKKVFFSDFHNKINYYLCSPMNQDILSPRSGSQSSSLVWSQV